MFLKNLDIFGFKSFADKTHIEFAEGITALLGPNGCGKSNVVDAIKWVIGEQSAKAMRAEAMEDVIFNGTETRRPLNVAEVTLTLANDSGVLPIDVPEVQIKRRLYRSGESEYFINGKACRLKEVRELFWDTGVGKAAYSVMEQGKIDQALSSRPEDRRYIFDEAAGINRNKSKNREAELKIARFEENIKQVNIMLGETKKSYDVLKAQAEKTLKYRALKDEIFGLERDIQLLRMKQFRDGRDERKEALKNKIRERDAAQGAMDKITSALTENMDLVDSLEKEHIESQKTLFGLAKEKNGLENEIKLLSEQRNDAASHISQNEAREKAVSARIEDLEADAEEQFAMVLDLRKKVEAIERNISVFDENITLTSGRITQNEEEIRACEQVVLETGEEQAVLEAELEAITDDIVEALDAGLKNAGYSASERKNAQERMEDALLKLKTIFLGKAALANDLARAVSISEEAAAFGEIKKLSQNLASSFSEAPAKLEELIALFESYVKSTPSFIDEFLAPEGIVTKKRALDKKISDSKDAARAKRERIAGLRENNETLSVKIDEYKQTLQDLRLQKVQLAADAKGAEEQEKLIRREISGQNAQLKALQDDIFLIKKRLDEIDERISGADEGLADIEKRGSELSCKMEKLEKDIEKRNSDISGSRAEINKQKNAISSINGTIEKIQLELVQAETEIKNIQDNFKENHSRDLMEFEERIYQITIPAAELREKLTALRSALKDLGAPNLMAPEEFNEAKERYEFLSGQINDLMKAREDEEKVAAEIRAESSALFLETYNKIKKNFHNMFRRLFGGGRGELRLTDPNHVLESGVEIYAQPPGKKQEHISLLSGGEKSMTAVALLFSTYMVKPSPFCLLDEIDAALDEDNVLRFVNMLSEFGKTSQFIVITHNKKTVLGASTLLGVTQKENGVTTMISIRMENKEEAEKRRRREAGPTQTFEEEDVPEEEGRELPPGVDDPSQVSEKDLRPIRNGA
ncbi:MAG: AAA family ATPase [Spirochaetaceae bacterium]|nr:AAA family ATPase [Spirochaetaceae bacterium]